VAEIRARWIDEARSLVPCDHEAAEAAARAVYQRAGLERPDVVWADSPYQVAMAVDAARLFDCGAAMHPRPDGPTLAGGLLNRLRQAGACRWIGRTPVLHRLWDAPHQLIGETPIPSAVRWAVDDALAGSHSLDPVVARGRTLWSSVLHDLGMGGGAPALSAIAHCDQAVLWEAYLALSGVADPVIEGMLDVLRLAGWIVPLDGLAVLGERPVAARAHSPFGMDQPCLVWADGSVAHEADGDTAFNVASNAAGEAVYRRHDAPITRLAADGVAIPADIWKWTLADILGCPDPRLRRAMVIGEGYADPGPDLRPLAVADDPGNPGNVIELYELRRPPPFGSGLPRRIVRVADATCGVDGVRRRHTLAVPDDIDDPIAAVAATFGLDADTYRQLVRAC
jgi:hypothetical protein